MSELIHHVAFDAFSEQEIEILRHYFDWLYKVMLEHDRSCTGCFKPDLRYKEHPSFYMFNLLKDCSIEKQQEVGSVFLNLEPDMVDETFMLRLHAILLVEQKNNLISNIEGWE